MKLALIDDHSLVLAGLSAILKTSLKDLSSLSTSEGVDGLIDKHNDPDAFDLILLDYHLPNTSPEENFSKLKNQYINARICFVSSDENAKIMSDSIKNGAAGFIVKSSNVDLFVATIEFVLAGGTPVPTTVLKGDWSDREHALSLLSPRQKMVFDLLLEGLSNKNIARQLNISESTVKTHLQASYKQLGITSRLEAITLFRDIHLNHS